MVLKLGIVMMALAAALIGVMISVVLTEGPARSAAVESAEQGPAEPLKRSNPEVEPWREEKINIQTPEEPEKEPERSPEREETPEPQTRTDDESEPTPPDPTPRLGEPSDPKPEPDVGDEPPEPAAGNVASTPEERRYKLPDGAVLGLTVKALSIHDAPVFDSVGDWALGHGVGHHPETSMPWSDAPQRNVYLAGHRRGFPGTDSHRVFYRLGELSDGDEILLRDRGGKKYRYRVSETFEADPNDSWVMGQVRDRDMVTLQTCTGPNLGRRLIVRADRVS